MFRSIALRDAGVQALVTAGTLTIDQILGLTDAASHALMDAGVQALVTAGTLTPAHIAAIQTYAASSALRDVNFRFIFDLHNTNLNCQERLNRLLSLTVEQINNLRDQNVRRIFNLDQPHRSTGDSFYEARLELALNLAAFQRINIGNPITQNTVGITQLLDKQAERLGQRMALAMGAYQRLGGTASLQPDALRTIGKFL